MNKPLATFTFSVIAQKQKEVKQKLPSYIDNFVIENKEEFEEDNFHFSGVLYISADTEEELIEKLKIHKQNDYYEPYFSIKLNGKNYQEHKPLPKKLAFLKD